MRSFLACNYRNCLLYVMLELNNNVINVDMIPSWCKITARNHCLVDLGFREFYKVYDLYQRLYTCTKGYIFVPKAIKCTRDFVLHLQQECLGWTWILWFTCRSWVQVHKGFLLLSRKHRVPSFFFSENLNLPALKTIFFFSIRKTFALQVSSLVRLM